MVKYLLTLLLIVIVKIGFTQNTKLDYKSAFKIYNLTTFEEQIKSKRLNDTSLNNFTHTRKSLQILHPAIAYQWITKKHNFHEIELTRLTFGKVNTETEFINDTSNINRITNGEERITAAISIRYEYILNFNKKKDRKFVPSLGFGANPYYRQNNYTYTTSSLFPTNEKNFGIRVFITPRLSYYLNSELFIDVNVPICLVYAFYLSDKEDNPALSAEERTTSTFNFNQFPHVFTGRIGLGLKL